FGCCQLVNFPFCLHLPIYSSILKKTLGWDLKGVGVLNGYARGKVEIRTMPGPQLLDMCRIPVTVQVPLY
ncbi:MAG: hypothetical protein LBT40_02780, partial [Deltaproteobacteria bacterium]|nr:hypothetical protein [Deltaproteobacteria bacterium]